MFPIYLEKQLREKVFGYFKTDLPHLTFAGYKMRCVAVFCRKKNFYNVETFLANFIPTK